MLRVRGLEKYYVGGLEGLTSSDFYQKLSKIQCQGEKGSHQKLNVGRGGEVGKKLPACHPIVILNGMALSRILLHYCAEMSLYVIYTCWPGNRIIVSDTYKILLFI